MNVESIISGCVKAEMEDKGRNQSIFFSNNYSDSYLTSDLTHSVHF